MENTLDNFQPDNRIFRDLFIMVLCLVCCVFYTTYRLQNNDLYWYDWSILSVFVSATIYFIAKLIKKNNYDDSDAY